MCYVEFVHEEIVFVTCLQEESVYVLYPYRRKVCYAVCLQEKSVLCFATPYKRKVCICCMPTGTKFILLHACRSSVCLLCAYRRKVCSVVCLQEESSFC